MTEQKMLKGVDLKKEDQKYVLSAFCHRYTKDHKPSWACDCHKVQFESDADWLLHTKFYVTKTGRIDKRFLYCESSPTWPDNPEYNCPYKLSTHI